MASSLTYINHNVLLFVLGHSALRLYSCCKSANNNMEGARQDHTYSRSMIHRLTNAVDCYIVGDRFHDGSKISGQKKSTSQHRPVSRVGWLSKHNFGGVEFQNKQPTKPASLLLLLSDGSLEHLQIVHKQWLQVHKRAKPRETMARDVFHCFCYVCTKVLLMWTCRGNIACHVVGVAMLLKEKAQHNTLPIIHQLLSLLLHPQ